MEMMTRRSFLKITGAMALAVGAAGALSGCDAVDNALGSFFQQYGDQKGHAADSAGSFMYALSNQVVPEPATAACLVLAGLVGVTRRRR